MMPPTTRRDEIYVKGITRNVLDQPATLHPHLPVSIHWFPGQVPSLGCNVASEGVVSQPEQASLVFGDPEALD